MKRPCLTGDEMVFWHTTPKTVQLVFRWPCPCNFRLIRSRTARLRSRTVGIHGFPQKASKEEGMTLDTHLPTTSVIIPTHNRCASLKRTLDALCTQTYPLSLLEVLVVADGCTDETVDMLRCYAAPFALRVLVLKEPPQGPARRAITGRLTRVSCFYS
jgi:cellulose synthase/poly-beta-1,6-N-acetylglucosamine synthase-like glycosyltransferase